MTYIPEHERQRMPPDDFGDPETRGYPARTQEEFDAAVTLYGKAKNPETVKRNLIKIAKRKGFQLPEAWEKPGDEMDKDADDPGTQMSDPTDIVRPARLFTAGHYPKKGVTVTEQHLDQIVANTQEAPIQLGHAEPDVRFGVVRNLVRKGAELWGTLYLKPFAEQMCNENGIRSLSIGLPPTLDRLREVSITARPASAGSTMFNDVVFSLGDTPEETTLPDDNNAVNFAQMQADLAAQRAETERLRDELRQTQQSNQTIAFMFAKSKAEQTVDEHIRRGRVPAALKEQATAILLADQNVTFNNAQQPVGVLFSAFMAALPQYLKPALTIDPAVEMSDDEMANVELTADEKKMAKNMGFTEEEAKNIKIERMKKERDEKKK